MCIYTYLDFHRCIQLLKAYPHRCAIYVYNYKIPTHTGAHMYTIINYPPTQVLIHICNTKIPTHVGVDIRELYLRLHCVYDMYW